MTSMITEGGNAIPDSNPVAKEDVPGVVKSAKRELPPSLLPGLQVDIGSAGYKVESGDIDLMVDAADVIRLFRTENDKDPAKAAKQALEKFFLAKGIESVINGRNVHIGIPYKIKSTGMNGYAQVDVMVIEDAGIVAPWHQHGPRGMYDEPGFKGPHVFMVMNSIGKAMGLKFDSFGAKLMRRDNNEVVARTRDDVAKILLNPGARGDDLNSVRSIMRALANDPNKEAKLAQAREDEAKGLITLPESAPMPGTAAWFRSITGQI